jgi:hypothetical protein
MAEEVLGVNVAEPAAPQNIAESADIGASVTENQPAQVEQGTSATAEQITQQSAEENAIQAEIRRQAEADKAIADMAELYGIPNVKSRADLRQAKLAKLSGIQIKSSVPAADISVALTPQEQAGIQNEYNSMYAQYVNDGAPESVALALAKSFVDNKTNAILAEKRTQAEQTQAKQRGYIDSIIRDNPEFYKNGKVDVPSEVIDGIQQIQLSGLADNPYSAYQMYKSNKTQENLKQELEKLKATIAVKEGNTENAAATTGSASSGSPAAEKDFYTSKEWDELYKSNPELGKKMIRDGRFDKFAAKWK